MDANYPARNSRELAHRAVASGYYREAYDWATGGLLSQTPPKMPMAVSAGINATQIPAAASAELRAQAIDETASAKVAIRDEETCR